MNVGESLLKLCQDSGIYSLLQDPMPLIMIGLACVLLYLGIVKGYEPLLMVPIAFGMLLTNLSGSPACTTRNCSRAAMPTGTCSAEVSCSILPT